MLRPAAKRGWRGLRRLQNKLGVAGIGTVRPGRVRQGKAWFFFLQGVTNGCDDFSRSIRPGR